MSARVQASATVNGEHLIRHHLPLVDHLVRTMTGKVPAHVDRDDLTSAGNTALVAAAKVYEPARGVPFSHFAARRVRGALIDELRSTDWATRSVRSRARRLETARQELAARLGRTPTTAELARHLDMGTADVEAIEEGVRRAAVMSLQELAADTADDLVPTQTAGPEDVLLHQERLRYLHHAINALPERMRLVITRYFFEERLSAEIAAELGVTLSRVSQLRTEALAMLRDGLNSQLDPELLRAPGPSNGCVTRRRQAYFSRIASRSELPSRPADTARVRAA